MQNVDFSISFDTSNPDRVKIYAHMSGSAVYAGALSFKDVLKPVKTGVDTSGRWIQREDFTRERRLTFRAPRAPGKRFISTYASADINTLDEALASRDVMRELLAIVIRATYAQLSVISTRPSDPELARLFDMSRRVNASLAA